MSTPLQPGVMPWVLPDSDSRRDSGQWVRVRLWWDTQGCTGYCWDTAHSSQRTKGEAKPLGHLQPIQDPLMDHTNHLLTLRWSQQNPKFILIQSQIPLGLSASTENPHLTNDGTGESLFISWQPIKAGKICPEGARPPDPGGVCREEQEVALVPWAALSHSGCSHSRGTRGLCPRVWQGPGTSGVRNQELLRLQAQGMPEYPRDRVQSSHISSHRENTQEIGVFLPVQ